MNRNQKIVLSVGAGLLVIAAVARVTNGPSATAGPPREADVLLLRDTSELRFTNDSDINLHNCGVVLEGDIYAPLAELPAHGRGAIAREAFGRGDVPRDEFYRRSRQVVMNCLDDSNAAVKIRLK
jgi:hypothetical protein